MLERGLERAQQLRENKNAVRQFAIIQAREILQAAGVVDPKLEDGIQTVPSKEAQDSKVDPVALVVAEYKKGPLTPDSVTNFWQGFIKSSIEQAGPSVTQEIDPESIVVPAVNRTAEQLADLNKDRGMVYDPRISYPLLGKIFPRMGSYAVGDKSPITDEYEDAVWSDVDMTIDAPNRNTTEDQLRELFGQDRRGLRLSTYIWASQASKALTGKYLDQGDTWSRLLGSRRGGYVVDADFNPRGYLDVAWGLASSLRGPRLGGRSEGVKA